MGNHFHPVVVNVFAAICGGQNWIGGTNVTVSGKGIRICFGEHYKQTSRHRWMAARLNSFFSLSAEATADEECGST